MARKPEAIRGAPGRAVHRLAGRPKLFAVQVVVAAEDADHSRDTSLVIEDGPGHRRDRRNERSRDHRDSGVSDFRLDMLPIRWNQLLRLLGVVPEVGLFGKMVQFLQAGVGCIPVKDASSAVQQTA